MSVEKTIERKKTRLPAVAGAFYPSRPAELRRMIEGFFDQVPPTSESAAKAIIAPHAGYRYSGPIAASAYAQFGGASDSIHRIVLLGPSHCFPVPGLAASSAEAWMTPLGTVFAEMEVLRGLASLPQVLSMDAAHVREHSLEVQLPFLQVLLRDFRIVPLAVGDATDDEVAEVIEHLWGGSETRFIVSSDLSHYLEHGTARALDRSTASSIERLCPDEIGNEQACGAVPIRGLLTAARRRGLRSVTIDLRNSGDTAGPRNQVVGYGAFAFFEA